MFGIGIIAGTAWIHLLPSAFEAFGSPCLPQGWAGYGSGFVGVFGMAAAFSVQIIEMSAFSHKRRKFESAAKAEAASKEPVSMIQVPSQATLPVAHQSSSSTLEEAHLEEGSHKDSASLSEAHLYVGPSQTELQQAACETFNEQVTALATTEFIVVDAIPSAHSGQVLHGQGTTEDTTKTHLHQDNQNLSVMIFEAGIMFHSLIIGLTIGVTDDSKFYTLLTAIAFHQMFEGMALGVLIGNLHLSRMKSWVLGTIYPLTTPIGIAIGVALHRSYNGNDPNLILVRGILDSLSAGILFYNTYTELISLEINHNSTFVSFSKHFKVACFVSMYAGAAAMAVVGVWA